MKQTAIALLVFTILCASPLHAQTLDRLYERAAKFGALRISADKMEEAKYVEPQGVSLFLADHEHTVTKAAVSSIEFTGDPKVMVVINKVMMTLPEVGPFERIDRQSWVWNGSDWFLRIVPSPKPFEMGSAPMSNENEHLKVEFVKNAIDLGRHVQGDVIAGQLEFRTERKAIATVRTPELPGIVFDPITWQSDTSGVLKFKLDTVLLSESFQKSLKFDFIDTTSGVHSATATLTLKIDGRVRFTQIPKLLALNPEGVCIVQFKNLTAGPLHLVRASISNGDFTLDPNTPNVVRPGEVGTLKITYAGRAPGVGAVLDLIFKEDVLAHPTVVVPLQFVAPPAVTPTYTREELDAIQKSAPKGPPPRP